MVKLTIRSAEKTPHNSTVRRSYLMQNLFAEFLARVSRGRREHVASRTIVAALAGV